MDSALGISLVLRLYFTVYPSSCFNKHTFNSLPTTKIQHIGDTDSFDPIFMKNKRNKFKKIYIYIMCHWCCARWFYCTFGYTWVHLGTFGYFLVLFSTFLNIFWYFLGTFGYFLELFGKCGYFWAILGIVGNFGYFWIPLGTFGHF